MEFIIDTIDLEQIKRSVDHLPLSGVTSNPSIVKKTAPKDFFGHLNEIRQIIGKERSLHVQVVATEAQGIVEEAHHILDMVDEDVYIKIPVSYEGLKAIKILKKEGVNLTATAVYDLMQAYLALACGVDYIAPYVNRIGNLGADPMYLISKLSKKIDQEKLDTKILAASFKGVEQIRDALNNGAHAVTAPVEILDAIFANPNIDKAVNDFNADWEAVYGKGVSICDLK